MEFLREHAWCLRYFYTAFAVASDRVEHEALLRRVGSGHRYTFTNPGEQLLDRWMDQHAFVTWVETDQPWKIESKFLSSGLSLPLNVDGNTSQAATAIVSAARLKARQLADELGIVSDSGGPRKALIVQD